MGCRNYDIFPIGTDSWDVELMGVHRFTAWPKADQQPNEFGMTVATSMWDAFWFASVLRICLGNYRVAKLKKNF